MKKEEGRMRKVVIAVKLPGEMWKKEVVKDELPVYQGIVEGYIECCFTTSNGIHVFANDMGKINGMKRNIVTSDDVIFGPVFAVRSNGEGEFVSLTEDDLIYLGAVEK